MQFTKMQGAGNDFVLVESDNGSAGWPDLARAICDRHFGVGADGLLLLMPSRRADVRMRIFNADGSESFACGNGLRCLVKHFIDGRAVDSIREVISVETEAGVREARIHQNNGKAAEILVNMGRPAIGPGNTPAIAGVAAAGVDITVMTHTLTVTGNQLQVNLVSMGNPHVVYFIDGSVDDLPLSDLGPRVERHPDFAEGANFEVASISSPALIRARVWERGVGETLACGSGACAAVVAARLLGHVGQRVGVELPGGTLAVEWDGLNEVYLTGPAETVFMGEWL